MEKIGHNGGNADKQKNRTGLRRALMAAGVFAFGATPELPVEAQAQQNHQETYGRNSPNIMNADGNVTITIDSDGEGEPNVTTNGDGEVYQESHGANSPNIIVNKSHGEIIINGKHYPYNGGDITVR